MSVHGEYGRALDALLISVQRLSSLDSKVWAQGLVEARSSQHAELSMAAAACMRVLDSIDSERAFASNPAIGPDKDSLREAFSHLRAHCLAILGTSDSTSRA